MDLYKKQNICKITTSILQFRYYDPELEFNNICSYFRNKKGEFFRPQTY
jgi:hypothetical protein